MTSEWFILQIVLIWLHMNIIGAAERMNKARVMTTVAISIRIATVHVSVVTTTPIYTFFFLSSISL